MVVGEVEVIVVIGDSQGRGDGASPNGQDGPNRQQLSFGPGWGSEGLSEVGEDVRWQIHGVSSPRRMACQSPPIVAIRPVDLPHQMAKVQIKGPVWFWAAVILGCEPATVQPEPNRPTRTNGGLSEWTSKDCLD